MRRRLFLKIYVAFIGVSVFCLIVAGISGRLLWSGTRGKVPTPVRAAANALTPKGTGGEALQAEVDAIGARYNIAASLYGSGGELLATTHSPPIEPKGFEEGFVHQRGGPGFVVHLDDGRWLAAVSTWPDHQAMLERFLVILLVVFVAMAVGTYPVARRITRRLEALNAGVSAWGEGDLGARVKVKGKDEVAQLGESFNRAAGRVEQLVLAQKRTLASASHELRSPLARLRMAVALLGEGGGDREQLMTDAERDIEELDALIGDILLKSRLEAGTMERRFEAVDLTALLEQEGARVEARVLTDAPAHHIVQGNGRMLARLLRNLFENARRYGGDAPIEAWVEVETEGVRMVVADRGPGVPEGDEERIFEPFYRPAGHREGADGGVGLGLSMVREIATHHGGQVRYLPREGGGSCFEVRLPVAGAEPR